MKEIIESLLNGNIEIFVGIMTGVVSVLIALPMFRILERKKLFYSEESGRDIEERDRLRILEKEVVKLRKELSSDLLKNASKLIEQEISMYLSENIGRMTSEKLKESKVLEDRIFNEIEERVNSRIDLFLESKTDEDLAASKRENHLFQQRKSVEKELFHTVEQERRSAGLLKSVMINLFVIVNFALIVLYLLKGSELSQYGALSLSGLYISLAGFIIYIFRASNARTSVLLAIKEDLKKQHSAMEYIEHSNKSGSLSEHDIEFIRIMMTNHAEREKKVDHPYEMVLKGVSGTNIQFKGGKMAISEKSGSNK
ncbi:TPA: hypothetical protein NJ360_003363 [Vibrio parahaemolyticus]|uniref:hypothetical protein n=1 Tax=Vibrio parahaemolyticus TaxID=670 RepID=UPI000A3B90A1|nr:hypothetical protein [Vibrio parahaemolyticus]MDF4705533.1 hypothetical protein [Vibrio parahaemolyticus]OUD53089.1 hypothetical protein BTA15_07010 [Vibrio parahaemolyticus]HCE2222056.1 hypothetical protein [Vibrio parahaemolyticus]HCG7235471.1 hypothetical protein [Vibrio parahaemolyticus]